MTLRINTFEMIVIYLNTKINYQYYLRFLIVIPNRKSLIFWLDLHILLKLIHINS